MTNMPRFKEPDEYVYCPVCGEQYNCTYRDHTRCQDCEVRLVDWETYEEIKDKESENDEND